MSCIFALGLVGLFLLWANRGDLTINEGRIGTLERLETVGLADFSVETIGSQKIDLKNLMGRVVIVNFWASWCTPCLEEFPSMLKLQAEFKDRLVILAISQDDSREDIDSFLKSFPEANKNNFHIVWDKDRSLGKRFAVDRLPESLVLNIDGRMVKKIVGSINWYSKDSIEYIGSFLGQK